MLFAPAMKHSACVASLMLSRPALNRTMPMSMVRLSAGRESMSEATQALCFMAGANSIFTGDKLLTAANAGDDKDAALLAKLGLRSMVRLSAGRESMSEATQALCFLAGANSIFTGEKLLTTGNAGGDADTLMLAKLGMVR